jgi:hypothetical protein
MATPNSFQEYHLCWRGKAGTSLKDSRNGVSIASRNIASGGKMYLSILPRNSDSSGEKWHIENFKGDPQLSIVPRLDLVNRLLISAASGAGKSTFAASWISAFQSANRRKKDFFIVSRVNEDRVLDDLPLMQRLDIEDIAEDPLVAEDLENSIILFDDIATIGNRTVRNAILELRDDLMETGRHQNVTLLMINHSLFEGATTKKSLTEATAVIVFPRAGNKYHLRRLFKDYVGFDCTQFKRLLSHNSRWIYVSRTYPQYLVHENGAYLI